MAGSIGILSYLIACLTASILAYSPTSVLTTNRPVHLVLLTLFYSSIALWVIGRRTRTGRGGTQSERGEYASIPLQELQDGLDKTTKERPPLQTYPLGTRSLLIVILLATAALCVRIEILRRLLLASECASRSVEVWLPFLVAIYDAVRFQPRQDLPSAADDDMDATAYHEFAGSVRSLLLSSPWRYVPSAFVLSLGCHMVAGLWLSSESSHVCPLLAPEIVHVPRLQWLALFLDFALVVSILELALGGTMPASALLTIPTAWNLVLSSSAIVWVVIATAADFLQPENHAWLILENEHSQLKAFSVLSCKALFLAALCVSSLYSVLHSGLLHTSMTLTVLLTVLPGFRFIWSARRPYPPLSTINLTWSFVAVYLAWTLYTRTKRALNSSEPTPSTLRRISIFVGFLVLLWPGLLKTNTVHYHPIELLMYDAQNKHIRYLETAARSKSLVGAVRSYQATYRDNPPPGFDVWFEFARNRSVWLTDEFDQIFNDLIPFRAITPAVLRQQTREMVSNPWNEISGIAIRNGKATVQENVLPTHRWMLEGIVELIDKFSQYLPDMDLAFNLNDESRVAVPYSDLKRLEDRALRLGFQGTSHFSRDRGTGWKDIPAEPISDTVFENWSFQNTYNEWAASTCQPSSPARRKKAPLFKSQLCLDCAAEHNLGQFVANWSVAASPCHQPDLANLHGFYLSPAAFKATHLLRPVFSQSKVRGFNDILYPSAWNYMEKVIYAPRNISTKDQPAYPDPPFMEKQSTLYWRGATSEGLSAGSGAWRGMVRQRMVHMANNLTTSEHDSVTVLLPDKRHPERYAYTTLPGASLTDLGLKTDARFVSGIARCGGKDCLEQEQEFGLAEPRDFQYHWRHKYLIDLDGAAFSGRFLPFLQSRSLPLKAALFREWYDSRLVPWLHFVPLDLRLHGLWSTLAYFSGVQGRDVNGNIWNWKAHDREAQIIADAGREWSGKVLTKADMEVYFFRLLLEWGRLTDDRRDDLGFVV